MEEKTTRQFWIDSMIQIVDPVLSALAGRKLKKLLPQTFHSDRSKYAPLEAFGRTVCGIAPWLELEELYGEEELLRKKYVTLVLEGIDVATDPESLDYMHFIEEINPHLPGQPLVDAAFLSHALVRAPRQLAAALSPRVRRNLIQALKKTRIITPPHTNWLFFSAMVECALFVLGDSSFDRVRIDYATTMFEEWYKGDGVYGDGKDFGWDYYNSFVIQPMYIDMLRLFEQDMKRYEELRPVIVARASRYASILERMINSDGSYLIMGRSITYRFGAFQLLSQAALEHFISEELQPAQVRCALTAVIRKVMQAENMFDGNGWLLPGVYGHQPSLAEGYINIGSLYLCATVFLALGLPPEDDFWSGSDMLWTSAKIWKGMDVPPDHVINI